MKLITQWVTRVTPRKRSVAQSMKLVVRKVTFATRGHRWASTSTLISAISDIQHRHLLFGYRKKICRTENCYSDIGRVPISTSESIPISKKYLTRPHDSNPRPLFSLASALVLSYCDDLKHFRCRISDIG
jgi:hypothetical protein